MDNIGEWNFWGSIVGFTSAFILLILAKYIERFFSREQREILETDRKNKQNADSLKAQLDGWKNYSEQLAKFNNELSERLRGLEKRMLEQDIKINNCERDKIELWRRIEQLGGGKMPDGNGIC